jgi:heterodisulfide reductase subunit B
MAESFIEMARLFSMEVTAMEDWNCCGSSPAHSTSREFGLLLPARNLLLAESQGISDLAVLCPSCYVRLWDAVRAINGDEEKNDLVERKLGRRFQGGVRPRFFLEIMYGLGVEAFKERVKHPLQGLKCALYFGCLLSRQEWITGFDVEAYRGFLEELVSCLGGEAVQWNFERECCGAGLGVTKPQISDRMVDQIHSYAARARADCLVVFCPLCHMNLELRGREAKHLPVLYITELICLAAQVPHTRTWLGKHLVDVKPLLVQYGLEG